MGTPAGVVVFFVLGGIHEWCRGPGVESLKDASKMRNAWE